MVSFLQADEAGVLGHAEDASGKRVVSAETALLADCAKV
jgi:hypothetical protein